MTRVPIYVTETEVAPGLPTQRAYEHTGRGKPIGCIVLPRGMACDLWKLTGDMTFTKKVGQRIVMVPWKAVQAAVAGEYGLAWEVEPTP